ncbi:MAG: HAMP domain-containing histidine kinase [Deltaproteobacteria bacterium]|nr:HAMP domain-containing histidine kinase [Deltaproteobacteria bacterium]
MTSSSDDHGDDEARAIAEVLSLLAHDLKNPLAAVVTNVGFVDGFAHDLGPASAPTQAELVDVRESLQDARLACDALHRFVSNLEVIARELGHVPAGEPSPVDLQAILDETVARHVAAAESRRVQLDIRGEAGVWVLSDRDTLVRAADNALANAVQHAPSGTHVTVALEPRDGEVALVVIDDGLVIPPELREEALSRDGQARLKGRPDCRYGRGLSLYAAAVAARRAGGRLEVGQRGSRNLIALVLPRFDDAV